MIETQNIERETQCSLNHILPRAEETRKPQIRTVRLGWEQFSSRLHRNFSALFILEPHAAQLQHSNKDHYHEK
jgi:hypothetical protein